MAGAFITFISERLTNSITGKTGFPHAACLFERGGSKRYQQWYGFGPGINGGAVETSDRQSWIDTYIRFRTDTTALDKALAMIERDYGPTQNSADRPEGFVGKRYVYPFTDCITMCIDVAEICGLSVIRSLNQPSLFIRSLSFLNSNYTHYNDLPYPWTI